MQLTHYYILDCTNAYALVQFFCDSDFRMLFSTDNIAIEG